MTSSTSGRHLRMSLISVRQMNIIPILTKEPSCCCRSASPFTLLAISSSPSLSSSSTGKKYPDLSTYSSTSSRSTLIESSLEPKMSNCFTEATSATLVILEEQVVSFDIQPQPSSHSARPNLPRTFRKPSSTEPKWFASLVGIILASRVSIRA
jgi:hypothetical protein